MSEYQYYEFLAIDRPLEEGEQAEVRELSTRARITATSFVNEYHWGNFQGDPRKMMERYYDAHLYVTNWGTHQVMLRLPHAFLGLEAAEQYCVDPQVCAWVSGKNLILDLTSQDDSGDWAEGAENSLSAIVGVRAELAAGRTTKKTNSNRRDGRADDTGHVHGGAVEGYGVADKPTADHLLHERLAGGVVNCAERPKQQRQGEGLPQPNLSREHRHAEDRRDQAEPGLGAEQDVPLGVTIDQDSRVWRQRQDRAVPARSREARMVPDRVSCRTSSAWATVSTQVPTRLSDWPAT
jgi:hypothetical protein